MKDIVVVSGYSSRYSSFRARFIHPSRASISFLRSEGVSSFATPLMRLDLLHRAGSGQVRSGLMRPKHNKATRRTFVLVSKSSTRYPM